MFVVFIWFQQETSIFFHEKKNCWFFFSLAWKKGVSFQWMRIVYHFSECIREHTGRKFVNMSSLILNFIRFFAVLSGFCAQKHTHGQTAKNNNSINLITLNPPVKCTQIDSLPVLFGGNGDSSKLQKIISVIL